MNMLKKLLTKTLFAAALLNAAVVSAAVVNLNLIGTAQVGSSFTVEVWGNDLFAGMPVNEELLAFGLNIANNAPELFNLTNVDIAAPFADDSVLLSLDAAGSAFPGVMNGPENQSLLLASLTFFANGAGNAILNLNSDKTDSNQGLIFFKNGTVYVNSSLGINVSAVPLPAALPLLLAGLGLLGGIFAIRKGDKVKRS